MLKARWKHGANVRKLEYIEERGDMISQDFGSFNIFFGVSDSTKMFQHIFFLDFLIFNNMSARAR